MTAPTRPESAWVALAASARELADLADKYGQLDPDELGPTTSADPLSDLHTHALELVALTQGCRRATWQALRDNGCAAVDIAQVWDITPQQVHKVLRRTVDSRIRGA